jgi:hypothetical protein
VKKNIILLFLVFSIFVFSSCTQKNIDYKSENVNKQGVISKIEDVTKQGIISNIKVVNGVPKIFLDGKEFDVVAAQVYNQTLKYDSNWASQLKKTIDAEKAVGANLVLIHLWWSDLDKSTSRPKNLGDNLDFTYVDEIMDYAQSKDIKIMLLTGMHVFIPEWWKKEE